MRGFVPLLILREDDPRLGTSLQGYIDTPYFKLIHRMDQIERSIVPDGYRFITPDEGTLSEHIAICYVSERISADELTLYRDHPTYRNDLWIAIADEQTGMIVASGIAELDTDIHEGILEWIQVSPTYRGRGWGSIVVRELLSRLKDGADFVTVSGKENEPSAPRSLYERCGFEDGVIWHILRKR